MIWESFIKKARTGRPRQRWAGVGGIIWGSIFVYGSISDLTPTKKQYLEKMLFECVIHFQSGDAAEALGGMNNYLQITKFIFDDLQHVQTYIDKMWQVILEQSIGKSIRNDSDYSAVKKSVMDMLNKDYNYFRFRK